MLMVSGFGIPLINLALAVTLVSCGTHDQLRIVEHPDEPLGIHEVLFRDGSFALINHHASPAEAKNQGEENNRAKATSQGEAVAVKDASFAPITSYTLVISGNACSQPSVLCQLPHLETLHPRVA